MRIQRGGHLDIGEGGSDNLGGIASGSFALRLVEFAPSLVRRECFQLWARVVCVYQNIVVSHRCDQARAGGGAP